MVCFPKTYVHALNKKKIFFFASPLSDQKIKGGQDWSPSGGTTHFWGQTEISGRWGGQGIQKSVGCEIWSHFMPLFKDFKFESKTKKWCQFKVSKFPKFKKHVCPPPWGLKSLDGSLSVYHSISLFFVF